MKKVECEERLNKIVEESASEGYHHSINVRDWEAYGKNRTYFKVYETRDNSKLNREYDFGYLDNLTGEYVAGKKDLTKNYTLGGSRF